jgi:predicted nucleic acid-binding protein
MPFVVDASIAASWILPDEQAEAAMLWRERLALDGAVAPVIWWYEVRNLLLVAERRNRIDAEYVEIAFQLIEDYPITIADRPEPGVLMQLARRHTLTIYDAAYLEIALRMSIPLATLDKALIKAARVEEIALVP